MMIDDMKGRELLRKYRFYETEVLMLRHELERHITDFIYRYFEEPICFDVFLNDNGKYLVVYSYDGNQYFPKILIDELCEEYKVTFEGITEELHTDYEGNKSKGKIIYLFEIVKDWK